MPERAVEAPELFSCIEVEISSPCNLRCASCPNAQHPRKRAALPTELLADLFEQLRAMDFAGIFSPHFYNEPLMDRRLEDILRLFKERVPGASVYLFTNFTLMTPDRFDKLAPSVDRFVVTIDEPAVQKAYESLWPRLDPVHREKIATRSLVGTAISNRAGAVQVPGQTLHSPTYCSLARQYMTIDALGQVHLCCNDYHGQAVYGNVHEQTLLEIWSAPAYVAARELGFQGKHPLCAQCLWASPAV